MVAYSNGYTVAKIYSIQTLIIERWICDNAERVGFDFQRGSHESASSVVPCSPYQIWSKAGGGRSTEARMPLKFFHFGLPYHHVTSTTSVLLNFNSSSRIASLFGN